MDYFCPNLLPNRFFVLKTIARNHFCNILWIASLCTVSAACSSLKVLPKYLDNSPQFGHSHTGLVVLDPMDNQCIIEYKSDHLFTPASNTKLWTVFAAMQLLGDSIPSMAVCRTAGQAFIRGLGDPTFLHPAFAGQPVFETLRSLDDTLNVVVNDSSVYRYAPGWAWDDYPYYFQPERSNMPIYGNALRLRGNINSSVNIAPARLAPFVTTECDTAVRSADIKRDEFRNRFYLRYDCSTSMPPIDIPFRTSDSLLHLLLNDTLRPEKPMRFIVDPVACSPWDTLYNVPSDTLYKRILVHSDNFLAEQLLLVCALSSTGTHDERTLMDSILQLHFPVYAGTVHWVDGSGLSRYNQFTPRSMVDLLYAMYQNVPLDRLLHIMPAGGESGTLRYAFGSDTPYVFAKSGSMRNVYNLSGFLRTDSGKVLIFSFMNNHIQTPLMKVKKEMAAVLERIRKNYR